MGEIVRSELDTGEVVFFSVVDKRSQKGFSMNKRLFLMIENQFVCYFSNPKTDFPLTADYINKKAKMMVPLKQIVKIVSKKQDKQIAIQFWVYQNNKRSVKSWLLEVSSVLLLDRWQELFDDYAIRSRQNTETKNSARAKSEYRNPVDSSPPKVISSPQGEQGRVQYTKGWQLQTPYNAVNILSPSAHRNEQSSYFANRYFVSGSPDAKISESPEMHLKAGQERIYNISFEPSTVKQRSVYFNEYLSKGSNLQSTAKVSFKNYYRPYIDEVLSFESNYLKQSKLSDINTKYTQFIRYAQESVVALIDSKLEVLWKTQKLKNNNQRTDEDVVGWIKYEQLPDVTIQFGIIQLKNVKNGNLICDDSLNKMAANNLKNLQFLYDTIRKDKSLMLTFYVPMGCVVKYKGYTCFVSSKIIPTEDEEYQADLTVTSKMVSKEFDNLSNLSRIGLQIFQNEKLIKFVPLNARKDKFAICYAKNYLPQLQDSLIMRKESFNFLYSESQPQKYRYKASRKQAEAQTAKISAYIEAQIDNLSDLMNKLEMYPVSPQQLSQILHIFGINFKHLSRIYSRVSQSYIQSIIKTQVVVRVFRTIFKKKLQQNLAKSTNQFVNEQTGKELLNILLGDREETSNLWKVVSLHTQMYFNLAVEMGDMNKGYLLLGLSHKLGIQIFNAYTSVDEIFKVNDFVEAIKFHPKLKYPDIVPLFVKEITDDNEISLSQKHFKRMVECFRLQEHSFPTFLSCHTNIYSKILYLFSYFVDPNDKKYEHLKIYDSASTSQYVRSQEFNMYYLQKKLVQIKWEIKNQSSREQVLALIAKLKETVQSYYGKYHPFISDIYQLQSLYYLQLSQSELAISINKQSLSNMIQCCGNNNRHIKISNNYYQLAEVYKKAGRFDEAIQNYKKSKNILQINSHQHLPQYAYILFKLGQMHLLQNRNNESYDLYVHALEIYQKVDLFTNWQQLVQLYQAIYRCSYKASKNMTAEMQDVKLAEHCVTQLQKILQAELQFELCSDQQLAKLLKIIIEPYVTKLKNQDKSLLRNYLLQLCDMFNINLGENSPTYSSAVIFFKSLITEGKFLQILQSYMLDCRQILSRLQNEKMIGRLVPQRRNQKIENFDVFMKHMIALMGEPFLLHTIK